MSRASALDTLTDLAREARDKAGMALANERNNQQQIQHHYQMLMNYREEYAAQLQQLMLQGINPTTLYNYRQFLMSLDESIQKASRALQQQAGIVDKSKQSWQQQQRKLSSFTTLNERRLQAAQLHFTRKEQQQTDEFANQSRIRNGTSALAVSPERSSEEK